MLLEMPNGWRYPRHHRMHALLGAFCLNIIVKVQCTSNQYKRPLFFLIEKTITLSRLCVPWGRHTMRQPHIDFALHTIDNHPRVGERCNLQYLISIVTPLNIPKAVSPIAVPFPYPTNAPSTILDHLHPAR